MRAPGTLDLIAEEFAAATGDLDFDRAEGWLATAVLAADRDDALSTPRGETSGPASSSR